jgi:hypothetical protein
MTKYPQTGSTLAGSINTGLSTQILVKVDGAVIGAIQSLQISQSRTLERIKELGTDGILEIIPNKATEYTIRVTRIVFDKMRLPEAFARGFINIKAQIIPFDILIIDQNSDPDNPVTHTLVNCWFATYSPKYDASSFIISEDADIWCEDIRTTGASYSNMNETTAALHDEEKIIDSDGSRRGSMDTLKISEITRNAFPESNK